MGLDGDVAIVNGEKRAINSLSGHKAPPGQLVVVVGANWNSLVDCLLVWMGQNVLFFFTKCEITGYHLERRGGASSGVTSHHLPHSSRAALANRPITQQLSNSRKKRSTLNGCYKYASCKSCFLLQHDCVVV